MLLELRHRIPLIQSLTYFQWKSHKIAIPKFLILALLNLSPVIAAVLFSPLPAGWNQNVYGALKSKIDFFSSFSEIYIYVASFISPTLYILYERYQSQEIDKSYAKTFKATIRTIVSAPVSASKQVMLNPCLSS